MAKVTNVERVRPKPMPKPPVTRVTLELSGDEALFLASILMRVGGDPKLSRRKHADSIRGALDTLGSPFEDADTDDFDDYRGHRSSIYFKNSIR